MRYVKKINLRSFPFNKNTFVDKFKYWSWIILLFFGISQCLFFWSWANFTAVIASVSTWFIFTKTTLRPILLVNYPLSTFLILGFTFTQLYLPVIFTLIENKPVVYNLQLPYQVYFHMLLDFGVLLVSHKIYRYNSTHTKVVVRPFLQLGGFFSPPNNKQIWIIGLIGIAATFYAYIFTKSATQMTGNAVDKLIEALIPFSYAPFFIPLGKLYGSNKLYGKGTTVILILFTILLFAVSIARNSRGAFMNGFTAIGFSYGLGLLLGYYKLPTIKPVKLIIIFIGYWIFSSPLADLGTAMVIVRTERSDVSSLALVEMTLSAFQDKAAILARRALDQQVEQDSWNETYLNDIFLSRFCNIKYNDISLIQANKIMSNDDGDMYHFTISRILNIFPAPVVEGLGLVKDKSKSVGFSYGDYLYAKASLDFDVLGWNLAGHLDGTGMAAFGWFYLLFLGIGIIPVYALFDSFFMHRNIVIDSKRKLCIWQGQFSLCGLLALTSVFQFLPAESVGTTATFVLRIWVQMIFLYYCAYRFSYFLSRLF